MKAKISTNLKGRISGIDSMKLKGFFEITCRAPDGSIKWRDKTRNLVVNEGLNHILDVTYHGSAQVGTWYVGLKNTGAVAATDTMASHAGWTENVNYSEATRPEYVEAAASGQQISNAANKAVFSINADAQTIAGAFLTSDTTKGGSVGILNCAADFASPKSADTGDSLEVTYTISAADDGV